MTKHAPGLQIDDWSSIVAGMSKIREFDDTREHLLATGEALLRGKGFSAVGLAEILASAGVPKGSFYHYFRSKEGFGADLLTRYFERYDQDLQLRLLNGPGTARERLLAYFRAWASRRADAEDGGCRQCCLAVKLSAEVSDLSEPMREVLASGMQRTELRISQAILAGQQDGSLSPALQPLPLARALYQLWVGSELMVKVRQTAEPVQLALVQTEDWLRTPD